MSEWAREASLRELGRDAGAARQTNPVSRGANPAYDPAECVLETGREEESEGGRAISHFIDRADTNKAQKAIELLAAKEQLAHRPYLGIGFMYSRMML